MLENYNFFFIFIGAREKTQDVILFQGALKLIMFLPGNGAKDFRKNAADILTKFFAGDASLVAQIEENAESSHPISQMARASLPPHPQTPSKRRSANE